MVAMVLAGAGMGLASSQNQQALSPVLDAKHHRSTIYSFPLSGHLAEKGSGKS